MASPAAAVVTTKALTGLDIGIIAVMSTRGLRLSVLGCTTVLVAVMLCPAWAPAS